MKKLDDIRKQEQWTPDQCARLYPGHGVQFFRGLLERGEVLGYTRPQPGGRGVRRYLFADSVRAHMLRLAEAYRRAKLDEDARLNVVVKAPSMAALMKMTPEDRAVAIRASQASV